MQEISATEAACVAAVHFGIQIEFFGQNWILDKLHGIHLFVRFLCSGKQVLVVGNVGETRRTGAQTLAQ